MKYLSLSLLWCAYCFLHSYLISIRFTNMLTRLLKRYYAFYRLFYVVLSFVLLVPIIQYSNQIDDQIIITYSPPWSIIRYIVMTAALVSFFWAFFFDYDALSFFGIRQILYFLKPNNIRPPAEIKRSGLLGIVRHPMYLALIVFLCCQIFTIRDIVATTILTIYVLIGTILEEKKLVLEFGDEYIKYQREVPMLIPLLKWK